jgi:NAD(P)-dependent dehydrogenase (short-subunit alcohol dehydrogenase family)/acetyltransferase-like isoleucine patch superfamily enzyme
MTGWYSLNELKEKGITIFGKNIYVSKFVNIYNPSNLILHDNIRIDDFTVITCKGVVEIFNNVHIGAQCMISSSTKIVFGNYSGISSGVKLYGGCDDFSGEFLTNPMNPKKYLNVKIGDIILEEHVVVGSGSIILPDVILKEGTAVASLSLIKKNTEAWKIYGGIPAKCLNERSKKCLQLQKEYEDETKKTTITGATITEVTKTETTTNNINFKKKIILITGGSRGIGKSIAHFFKNLDYTVIVTYNKSIDSAKEMENESIYTYKMDVTDNEECKIVIQNIINKFNKIDILINNAGIIENQLLHKMSNDQWNNVINTNINSLYNVTHNVIQNMIENQKGKIINISSIYGLKGSKGQTNYSTTKHGTIGFTKSLALEYADNNILVNCICPGLVYTDMFNSINEKITNKIINNNPIKKIIDPIEIAKTCEFLINSEYCTGTIINIDCGMNC